MFFEFLLRFIAIAFVLLARTTRHTMAHVFGDGRQETDSREDNRLLKKAVWRQEPRIFLGDSVARPAQIE